MARKPGASKQRRNNIVLLYKPAWQSLSRSRGERGTLAFRPGGLDTYIFGNAVVITITL